MATNYSTSTLTESSLD